MKRLVQFWNPTTLFCLMVAAAMLMSERGADYRQYARWGQTAWQGDLARLDTDMTAVTGHPFSQWSAGPGLLLAPFSWEEGLPTANWPRWIVGLVCVGGFWFLFYQGLKELAGSALARFGCAMAAIATPLGYYSVSISSEAFALLPAGVLFREAVKLSQDNTSDKSPNPWATGTATGILLMIRPYLGVYAWPVLLPMFALACRRGWRTALQHALILGTPILLAIWQVATVNAWMTGDPARSPYAFGDEKFDSLSQGAPHLGHVLLDTFHGLLPTHPLLALTPLLLLAIMVEAARRRNGTALAVWVLAGVAVAVNVYIQSGWYYWWMAFGPSFGMRGLVLAAVPCVAALVRRLFLLRSRKYQWARASLLLGVTACGIWSWLLLSQGPMDYLTWPDLFDGQQLELRAWLQPIPLGILIVSAILCGGMLRPRRRGVEIAAWLAATLALAYLVIRQYEHLPSLAALYVALAGAMGCAALLTWGSFQLRPERIATALPVATLLVMLLAFGHLWLHTAEGVPPPDGDVVTFHAAEVAAAHNTLVLIPRMDEQRQAIAEFLLRAKGPKWCAEHLAQPGDEPLFRLATKAHPFDLAQRKFRSQFKRLGVTQPGGNATAPAENP